ncbi:MULTISPECIES: amidase [unclassified Achromobacter]|uniref:amidase n=1 Tax=unclassified Achromobacter TaxID=2626865 RepID=UPI000B51945B|nr:MULTISPECIES: amidase [unclassified Achromobacter]OWT80706.1 hypothetical protein CEY05_04825 [Achromobacter sp. HZ34]OWT81222.1 hypothetical protein CEY04_04815 [Achromobacter sp. HZ28]
MFRHFAPQPIQRRQAPMPTMTHHHSLSEPHNLTIAELIDAYRHGTLSPVDVTEQALARAEACNDQLRAFVTVTGDQARAAAAIAESAYRRGEDPGPLGGIPMSIKDIVATRGIRTTFGSARSQTNVPNHDAIAAARWLNAGAVIIGKTATPEFACRQTTSSPVSGITRNPWNPALTPGGSSGGSSASLAAGIGHLSLVTDGGGSARLPAACTGIVGLKPTLGRIPYDGAADVFGGLAHMGIMGRNAADVAVGLTVAEGAAAVDPYSFMKSSGSDAALDLAASLPLAGLRVGLRECFDDEILDPEIQQAVRRLAGVMESLGATVLPLEGRIEAPLPIWRILQHAIWAQRYGNGAPLDGMDPVIVAGISSSRALSAADLQGAIQGRTRLYRHVQGWLEKVDFVLSPTLTRTPLAADHPGSGAMDPGAPERGEIREHWAPLLGLFTMTGHPGISFNCGWTAAGLPIGAHLATSWHADHRLLDTVKAIEGARPQAAWRLPARIQF